MSGFLKPWPDFRPIGKPNGKNWTLVGALFYLANDGTLYAAAQSASTDGPSVPQQLQSIVAATGDIFMPGVLHDALWRGYAMKRQPDGSWRQIFVDYATSTGLFKEAMLNNGVTFAEAEVAYDAVMEFGQSSFVQDLAAPLPKLAPFTGNPEI